MQDNLAHTYEQTQPADHQVQQSPLSETRTITVPSVSAFPKGLTRLEKMLVGLFACAIFALLVFNVYSAMSVAHLNRQVQDSSAAIAQTEVEIDNLTQEVHELSRYERVYQIAREKGLELNEENIKNLLP